MHGHYGPAGGEDAATGTAGGGPASRGRGAEVALKYGGDVVAGRGGGRGKSPPPAAQDEDEAQLDPEILALIEKEIGGGAGGSMRRRGGVEGEFVCWDAGTLDRTFDIDLRWCVGCLEAKVAVVVVAPLYISLFFSLCPRSQRSSNLLQMCG